MKSGIPKVALIGIFPTIEPVSEFGSIVAKMPINATFGMPLFMPSPIVPKVIHYYRKLQTGFKWHFCGI